MTLLFAGLWIHGAEAAGDVALARCRTIADNAARLACYDALRLGAPQTKGGPAGAQGQPQAAPIVISAEQFGFEERIIEKEGVPKIESRVAGKFEGWSPSAMIRLVNGQVWQVTDVTSGSTISTVLKSRSPAACSARST